MIHKVRGMFVFGAVLFGLIALYPHAAGSALVFLILCVFSAGFAAMAASTKVE